jgi:hypothetical protein
MARITSIVFASAAFCLGLTGCAHCPDVTKSNQQSYERMQAETERAFELERSADLVIDYERPDGIRLWTPPQSAYISANDETLAAAISNTTAKRGLAVVIIGKPVRHAFPEPQLRSKVDAIESVVRAQGFARIVFQLASASGRPIYRE